MICKKSKYELLQRDLHILYDGIEYENGIIRKIDSD